MIEIIKKNSDVKLLIVGENYEPLKKYHDLVYKYKLEKSVSFINKFVNQDEIKYWFCSSELVILPYKNASQSGIASLAIQFEIPIVSSDVGGLSEFIIDNKDGFLSKPDSKELSNKIILIDFLNASRLGSVISVLADGSTFGTYGDVYKFPSVRLASMNNVNDLLSYSMFFLNLILYSAYTCAYCHGRSDQAL